MNPVLLELIPHVHSGRCCAQLLFQLLLNVRGEENPGMIRAMQGLCHGIGQSEGHCGLLPAGACILAYLGGSGREGEEAHPMLTPMLHEYACWFLERTSSFGSCSCPHVAQGMGARQADGTLNQVACGELLAECWQKLAEIAEAYGLDPLAHTGEDS